MEKKTHTIHIIGGGISGLVAAQVLENHGVSPVIIEGTDRVGGRVKTDTVNGYRLDHGFQVLLTVYPAAKQYLDYDSLDLQKFVPGASIFKNKNQKIIGDPLRDLSLTFSTLFSGIGTVSDKIKILKLNTFLKRKSIEAIFEEKEGTTFNYLQNYGFSEGMIADFFTPFFSGIFLETKLETSSRMFEFVYKMFGQGAAAVPKGGMEEIPKQLKKNLKNTKFLFNTKVSNVKDGKIKLADGTEIPSEYTIIATEPSKLVPNLVNQSVEWKSCYTLYFTVPKRIIKKPLIGIVPDKNSLINNLFYPTSLATQPGGGEELLSVTVINNKGMNDEELTKKVQNELSELCEIRDTQFLKLYKIPMSLPDLRDLRYSISPSETHLSSGILLAGDTQLNGSLNAAMISGERAALAVVQALDN
ncbi:MAG: NAD(P)/FAD-dependent oxidoreductase [Flavobacteriales bacterium]|jgi:protoporphyrinogen oxidase